MKQTETNFSLKDQLFNKNKVQHLAELIFWVYPEFDKTNFKQQTNSISQCNIGYVIKQW